MMNNIEYLTDKNGQKKAVVIPIEIWNKIMPNAQDKIETLMYKNGEKIPKAGLNLGAMSMSNDFDKPLSDSFWLGEEE